jgi:Ca2+-binding EF-hand superfamily protein
MDLPSIRWTGKGNEDPFTNLGIFESIIGRLNHHDVENSKRIHSSDFQRIIADLGVKYSHPVVVDIVRNCKCGFDGIMDYNGIEDEVERARLAATKHWKAKAQKEKFESSSRGVIETLDDLNSISLKKNQDIARENQLLINRNRDEIIKAFKGLAGHTLTIEQFRGFLKYLGIIETGEFQALLRRNVSSIDMTFAVMSRSLTRVDPGLFVREATESSKRMAGDKIEQKYWGRRHFRDQITAESVEVDQKIQKGRETAEKHLNSRDMKNVLALEADKVRMISHSRGHEYNAALHRAAQSEESFVDANFDEGEGDITYTAELKLVREQVLAMLRDVDEGERDPLDFLEAVSSMGFDLPSFVRESVSRKGGLDYKRCVQLLDSEIFQERLKGLRASSKTMESIFQRFMEQLTTAGAETISSLRQVFSLMDENNDKSITYSEFCKACRSCHLEDVSEKEMQAVFNHLDTNGNGRISYDEFIRSVRVPLSSRRTELIALSFKKLDRTAHAMVPLSIFLQTYDVGLHPDVVSGKFNEATVLKGVAEQFKSLSPRGVPVVTQEDFDNYFSSLSTAIEDDADFEAMMRRAWRLGDKDAPPADMIRSRYKPGVIEPMPTAKRVHGDVISWTTEETDLEKREEEEFSRSHMLERKKGAYARSFGSSIDISDALHKEVSPEESSSEFYASRAEVPKIKKLPDHRASKSNPDGYFNWNSVEGENRMRCKQREKEKVIRSLQELVNADGTKSVWYKQKVDPHSNAIDDAGMSFRQSNNRKAVKLQKRTELQRKLLDGSKPYGTDGPSKPEVDEEADNSPKKAPSRMSLAELLKTKATAS